MRIELNTIVTRSFALACGLVFLLPASAGTFKRINIDGSFTDWAGVPVAAADDEGDAAAGFDFREVYVANDDKYVCFLVRIYPSSTNPDYNQFHHQFFIDADNDPSTGLSLLGLGSELAVEDVYAFSQRSGTQWSDGGVSGIDYAEAPTGVLTSYAFETRISRSVKDSTAGDIPVFTQDLIAIACATPDKNWNWEDTISSFTYEIAPNPPALSGTQGLVGLTTAPWNVNDAGTDLGADWLAMDYDDAQAGWKTGKGLFGFNAPPGVYPISISTTLTSGRSAYYFRTRFDWSYDMTGAGLLMSNYLSAGAVFYLNGAEVRRVRMPDGPVTYATPATGGPAQPGAAEVFELPVNALLVGANVLQVEVHPAAGATGSLVFGLALIASDNLPPRIVNASQPADRTVVEGEATTFTVGEIGGTGPFSYQWLKDGAPIPGATSPTFTLDPVLAMDAGDYSVEIANPKGAKVTSRSAKLTVTSVPVAVDPAQPADLTAVEGTAATFVAVATGSLPTYQWFDVNGPIPGAVGPQLTLDNVSSSDTGKQYWVVVSNSVSSVTSRKATLTVLQDKFPPQITGVGAGGRRLSVTFSEPLDAVSAEVAANYTLDGGVQVQDAALDLANANRVSLRTTPQQYGSIYHLSAKGVKDLYGNPSVSEFAFQSSISVDGDFDDWSGIPVALTKDQTDPSKVEFKDVSITNDTQYIYLRFSFYTPAGPLWSPNWGNIQNYYQVVFDTDADSTTGGWNGGEVMDEVNTLFRLDPMTWTSGNYPDAFIMLAPVEAASTDFEVRVSLTATHGLDHKPAFPNRTMNVFCCIRNTDWAQLDITPPIEFTLGTLPSMPTTITARRVGSKIELTWPGGGVLETRTSLTTGTWTPVPGAVSGIQIDPTGAAGFYRVRR
jgi:hypothetical protein